MFKVIQGDVLKTTAAYIIHQVNAVPVMGSGLARQIADLYPNVEKVYKEFINVNKPYGKNFVMGQSINVKVTNSDNHVQCICNVVGQYDCGMNRRQTEYRYLFEGILSVLREAESTGNNVALPWQLGCYRGGGDWNGVVLPFLQNIAEDFKYDILIYKLN